MANNDTLGTNLQGEIERAKVASDKEHWQGLAKAYDDLTSVYTNFKGAKRLFSVDDSDTFRTKLIVDRLNTATTINGGNVDTANEGADLIPLRLEFIKAGTPIPASFNVAPDTNAIGETRYVISTNGAVQPAGSVSYQLVQVVKTGTSTASDATSLTLDSDPPISDIGNGNYSIQIMDSGKVSQSQKVVSGSGPKLTVAKWDTTPQPSVAYQLVKVLKTGQTATYDGNSLTLDSDPAISDIGNGSYSIQIMDSGKVSQSQKVDSGSGPKLTVAKWDPPLPPPPANDPTQPTTYYIKRQADMQTGDQLIVYQESADDRAAVIQYRIDQIDAIISAQLSAIMHDLDFRKLEASWRGLHQLVFNTETGTRMKLRLLNVKQADLQADLDNAVEFDQSALFKKVYEAEYGMFGGSPYSALLVDYEFGRDPKELSLLTKLSNVAAAAHAPLITAAAPALFNMERFADLDKPRDLATIFDSALHIAWRAFRSSEDSRYVALALPHVMMRLPYGPHTNPVDEFNFVEDVVVTSDEMQKNPNLHELDKFLWGNAAWSLAQRITNAFSLYSWTAAIRGYEGGGLVADLPIYTFRTDDGHIAVRVPTEVAITDRREKELSDLGFIALCYRKETDQAAFFGGQTANKPKVYIEDNATANARLSAQLPYMLAASRFAHYIKVLMRDRIGSFMSQDQVARLLNRWISQYVLLDDLAGQQLKARYPLREARVDVAADPARPGCYKAIVFLRPHFQLEELTVSMRLVAELPPPAGS